MGQTQSKDLNGCMVALVTPMNSDGSINFTEYNNLVQWHIAIGTDALVVAGTTGESALLTREEINLLTQTTSKLCQGTETKVIVGTGAIDPKKVIDANSDAKTNGADAVLIVTPYYLTLTQEALYQHFFSIAQASELPIILYNVPTRTAIDLKAKTTSKLAKLNQIIGIKEAKADMERISQLLKIKDFAVLSGDDSTFVEAMKLGAHGVISVAANVRPVAIKKICNSIHLGDNAQADTINTELAPLYQYLFHEPNPCPVKSLMHHSNMISSGIRKPLVLTEIKTNQVKPYTQSIIQEFSSI